jgi:hypothetical protein
MLITASILPLAPLYLEMERLNSEIEVSTTADAENGFLGMGGEVA